MAIGASAAEEPVKDSHAQQLGWIVVVAGILVLVGFFYLEENWRGKRAWEHYKKSTEACGGMLDWAAYLPAAIPAGENFFQAPHMAEWFVGHGGSSLTARLANGRDEFLQRRDTNPLVEITLVSPAEAVPPRGADAVLAFNRDTLFVSTVQGLTNSSSRPGEEVIPLIVMDEVPLGDAIKYLARQAQLNYIIDPSAGLSPGLSQPSVSLRWTDLTADGALLQLLKNYNLRLIADARSAVVRITQRGPSEPDVDVESGATRQIAALVEQAIGPEGSEAEATAASGFTTFVKSRIHNPPVHIFVRAITLPTTNEISQFFPQRTSSRS